MVDSFRLRGAAKTDSQYLTTTLFLPVHRSLILRVCIGMAEILDCDCKRRPTLSPTKCNMASIKEGQSSMSLDDQKTGEAKHRATKNAAEK